jgi:hypothetical protein
MCYFLCSNPNQYMQEDKIQNNRGMVNFNFNIPNIRCILFWKPPLCANVIDYNLIYINVMKL